MKKKLRNKSILWFVLGLIFTAFMVFVTVFGVNIGEKNKGSAKNIILGLDLKGGVSITYQAKGDYTAEEFSDTIKKLKKRAEEFSTESDVYQEGDNRITVDIPGQDNAEEVLEKLGKPGALSFVTDFGTENEKTWVEGSEIKNAQPETQKDQTTGQTEYVVAFELNDSAASKFAEVTSDNIGSILYVVYDGEAISSPVIQSAITGGSGVINGMDDFQEAEELASMIRIGSLSVELESISSKVVSPKLGDNALETSVYAGALGLLVIVLFMIAVYRIPGIAAGIALIIYTAADLICINGFNMTLTLPGIAGVILSIGMAVDANVIIYARIKEELADGASVENAIKTGFKKATSAIVDGNVTTFIATLVLMAVGTGTIRGFAQTLAVGIILSMFTALCVSRIIVMLLYRMGCDKIGMYGVAKERRTMNFLGKRYICFVLSGVIIIAGIVAMIMSKTGSIDSRSNILNYSVEFQGGLSTTVEFDKNYDVSEFNDKILPEIQKAIDDKDVIANAETGTKRYVIRTKNLSGEQKEAMKSVLVEKFGALKDGFEEMTVSATTSSEMRRNAIIAVCIATICMLIYIFVRFRDIKFATSAVIALVHDVFIVLAFYSLTWTNVGNTFIACMLTIVGYSINATIVIFDRIRENIAVYEKKKTRFEIVNMSITQTLTRSLYTSFTTFVMVFFLYIFGVAAIKEFALPLIIGVIFGGYSSVFITGALWYVMGGKDKEKAVAAK